MRKHEVFLTLKRELALTIQAVHKVEEIIICTHRMMKDEEARCLATMKTFEVVEKKLREVTAKLNLAESDKKSTKASLAVAERQVEAQRLQFRQTKDDYMAAKKEIEALTKSLREFEKAKEEANKDREN